MTCGPGRFYVASSAATTLLSSHHFQHFTLPKTLTMPSITLHRGWDTPGIFVWSPFVTKVEARFRFAGLEYKTDAGGPRSGPRGKIPYIEVQDPDGDGPKALGDSSEIIKALVHSGNLPDLNVELSPVERAFDMALRALLEEKLYFYQVRCFQEYWEVYSYQHNPRAMKSGMRITTPCVTIPFGLFLGLCESSSVC